MDKAEGSGCGTLGRDAVMGRMGRTSHRLAPVVVPKEEFFAGGLLGVRAKVVLVRHAKKARITLSGVPMGGTVTGEASFSDAEATESGTVVVSEPLASVLRRRAVRLVGAAYDSASDTVKVTAKLPIFGTRNIVLARRSQKEV